MAAVALTLVGGPAGPPTAAAGECGLLPCLPAPTVLPGGSRKVLVRLAPAAPLDIVFAGATVERRLTQLRILSISVPEATADVVLAGLRRNPAVEAVEPEATYSLSETTPNDAHWTSQWGLRQTGFPQAWDVTHGSPRIVVGVLDTGVERSHPDLAGAVLAGRDFVSDDADPADEAGHGTAVAGILAARTNNRAGVAGACWSCRVLPVRVLGRDGKGESATLAAGIVWAVDHGADVLNLSLGGDTTTMAERDAVAYAVGHDVVVVAAAGNDGKTRREYPAATAGVIGVAGSDAEGRLYDWSNRGSWVDVAAPGCNTSPWRGHAYSTFCGTSSAAPLVSGLAALVRSAHPGASAAEIARLVTGRDGRLDAARAFPRPPARASRPAARVRHDRMVTRVIAALRR
jgi:thermitase